MKTHGAFDESATFCLKCDIVASSACVAQCVACALCVRVNLAMEKYFFCVKFFFTYPLDERNEDMIQFAQPLSEKGKVLRR